MPKPNYTNPNYTPIQLKLPLEIERIIDISDPVYSFNEIMNRIDLKKILALKESGMGRPRCDSEKMLKVILFSFMENGYLSLRNIKKACRTDIRYMWLLDGMKVPAICDGRRPLVR
jgi:transposase